LLPTFWYRNTWSSGCTHEGCEAKSSIRLAPDGETIALSHVTLGRQLAAADTASSGVTPAWLFTENESNAQRLFGSANESPFVKDAFHEYVIHGRKDAVNPRAFGTKVAAFYELEIPPGGREIVRLRLAPESERPGAWFGDEYEEILKKRLGEADDFHAAIRPNLSVEQQALARHACAGLLWSKQFYHLSVADWLDGDPSYPPPPPSRKHGRNHDWGSLFNRDVLLVPDKWEYPWYAAWDSAFHAVAVEQVDLALAKEQLLLFLREWYMNPNGQLPAYEFDFSDVNPPVHAWACWHVYQASGVPGKRDVLFLERAFQKLLLNFTWWVNRKDPWGRHLFSGGFLGLDNIGVFDRSKPLPTGGTLQQADGTAWMAFYCGTMLSMALELACSRPAYEDLASKFFEHYVQIIDAINALGGTGLWDEEDGFYYDQVRHESHSMPLRCRSLVGLIPLVAVELIEQETLDRLPGFAKRAGWFLRHRSDLLGHITYMASRERAGSSDYLLAVPSRERLTRLLRYMLDEREFLSPFGIRSLSRIHGEQPYVLVVQGEEHVVRYTPGESDSGLFGGNSNWRGPIWFPINYLLVEALEQYGRFYGSSLKVELPTGSGREVTLSEVATELAGRLIGLFLSSSVGTPESRGCRCPAERSSGSQPRFHFHEYYHGETGAGLGASHQTGWTALVMDLLAKCSRRTPVP
jgi:hypothetical protein